MSNSHLLARTVSK